MNNSTNPFYAIQYSYWEFEKKIFLEMARFSIKVGEIICPPKSQAESVETFNIRRDAIVRKGGIANYHAERLVAFLIGLKSASFLLPAIKLIIHRGYDNYLLFLIFCVLGLIIILIVTHYMDEKYSSKYYTIYENRSNSWKLRWKIITIFDFFFSFACIYWSSLLVHKLR